MPNRIAKRVITLIISIYALAILLVLLALLIEHTNLQIGDAHVISLTSYSTEPDIDAISKKTSTEFPRGAKVFESYYYRELMLGKQLWAIVEIDKSDTDAFLKALTDESKHPATPVFQGDRTAIEHHQLARWLTPPKWWQPGSARKYIVVDFPPEHLNNGHIIGRNILVSLDHPTKALVYISWYDTSKP